MRKDFTKATLRIILLVVAGLLTTFNSKTYAQLQPGMTYYVTGSPNQVAPIDTFASLMGPNGVITYLNQFGIDSTSTVRQAISIILTAGYTGIEPSSINIGNSTGGYPAMRDSTIGITLKPQAGLSFAITTNAVIPAFGSLVRFNCIRWFTIDGTGPNGERNLSFILPANDTLASLSGQVKVIDFNATGTSANGLQYITIKNCNIIGASTLNTIPTFAGIYVGTVTGNPSNGLTRGRNSNLSFINNQILSVQNGIYYRGNSSSANQHDLNLNISRNIIGSFSFPSVSPAIAALVSMKNPFIGGSGTSSVNHGIFLSSIKFGVVDGNVIRNSFAQQTSSFRAINLEAPSTLSIDSAIQVTNNQIYNITANLNSATTQVAGVRVALGTHITSQAILVANNSISGIIHKNSTATNFTSNNYTVGIVVEDNSANAGIEIYYNSVNLNKDTAMPNALSACFATGVTTTGGVILMNNVFSNTMGTGYNTALSIGSPTSSSAPFLFSSFNNYYCTNIKGGINVLAVRAGVKLYTTIKNYRLDQVSDTTSISCIPPFTNDTICVINAGVSHRMYNRAVALDQYYRFNQNLFQQMKYKVTTDMFGNPRNNMGRFSAMGCHLWSGDSTVIPIPLFGGGLYNIDNTYNPPTSINPASGSFRNITEAVNWMNSYGVNAGTGPINLVITNTYTGEPGYIPVIGDYQGALFATPIVLSAASGVNVNISMPTPAYVPVPNYISVLRICGTSYFTIDGKANRQITFSIPTVDTVSTTAKVITISTITDGSSPNNITIQNCNIIGASSVAKPFTAAGIYVGKMITTSSSTAFEQQSDEKLGNLKFSNNYIAGVRNGIRVLVSGTTASSTASSNNLIYGNIIGGTIAPGGTNFTTYIGGEAPTLSAGIYVKGWANSVIDSNVIRNCIPTAALSEGFRGIEIDEASNQTSTNITLLRNFIYNLNTITGKFTYGIRLNLATTAAKTISLESNFISSIGGIVSGVNWGPGNPTGVMIESTPALSNCNIMLYHNTINMNLPINNAAPGGTYCLYIPANIKAVTTGANKAGVTLLNNIFSNTGNRLAAVTTAYKACVVTNGANLLSSDKNAYYIGGVGAGLLYYGNATGTSCKNIFDVRSFTKLDQSSFNHAMVFKTDTTPDLVTNLSGLAFANANIISSSVTICKDIYNNPRAGCPGFSTAFGITNRCVGAVEFIKMSPPLVGGGNYYIDGTDNPPTIAAATSGHFVNVRSAANYLMLNGVDQPSGGTLPISLIISAGYTGENDTFTSPISFLDYPNMDPSRPVLLRVADGRFDTIRVNNAKVPVGLKNTSLLLISGCKFLTIDGNNNTPLFRGLTIMMPPALSDTSNRVIDVLSGVNPVSTIDTTASNVTITNCNIIGNSTSSAIKSYAGIYMGGTDIVTGNLNPKYGPNNNNTFDNNYIQGVRYGVYLRGLPSKITLDVGNTVSNNTIGGTVAPGGTANTTYIGGFHRASGILICAQKQANVHHNIIRNNLPAFFDPRGIEVATFVGPTAKNMVMGIDNKINANEIYNITSTLSLSGAYGIGVFYNNDSTNMGLNLAISNNRISNISATGSPITTSSLASNPYGIFLDASTIMRNSGNTDLGVKIFFNSINLRPVNTMNSASAASAALAINSNIRGGLSVVNNIFQNRLGVAAGLSSCYGVLVGGSVSPFGFSNNNNYYAKSLTSFRNAHLAMNVQSGNPVLGNRWDSVYLMTGHDSLSNYFYTPFDADSILSLSNTSYSNYVGQGVNIYGYPTDAVGTARNTIRPCIGAFEFSSSYIDSMAPRIFSGVNTSNCFMNVIPLNFVVSDRYWTSDTLYYIINNQPEAFTTAVSTNGTARTYFIQNVPSGAVVRYRISANDFSGNNSKYPYFKQYDTVSTNINTFPVTKDFEGTNNPVWSVESIAGNATWTYSYGSILNPPLAANTGLKTAMFNASALPAGASARLVSPCLDFTDLKRPAIRFFLSQSSDLSNKNDVVEVETSVGGGYFTKQAFSRVNNDYAFPGWKMYEVCLDGFDGLTGVKVSFKATAAGGGQNILIDDISIFDDYQTSAIVPKTFYACFRDSATFTIKNTSSRDYYTSYLLDKATSVTTFSGNGGDLSFKLAPNNSADTVKYYVKATNAFSGCNNILNDTVTVYYNRFYNGPFISPLLGQFDGSYNDGNLIYPDGAKVGDILTYQIKAPAFYQNSDYGTVWTVSSVTATSMNSGSPAQNIFFVGPQGNANAFFRIIPQASELDTTFKIVFTLHYVATGCDSVITRYLRVTTQPTATISTNIINPVDTVCALSNAIFSSVALNSPTAGPYTYLWNFGDGSTAGTQTVTKAYLTGGKTYTIRLTVGNYFGVTGTTTKTIYVRPSPNVDFTYQMPCVPDSTQFDAGSQPAGTQFLWTMPDNTKVTTQKAKYLFPTTDTTYTVNLLVTNAFGCSAWKTNSGIYVFAKPKAQFTIDNHCLGKSITINNTSTLKNSTPGAIWYFGNGDVGYGSSPQYKYPSSGTYTVKLISRSNFGCLDSTTRIVTVFAAPKADFTTTYSCTEDPTNFVNNSSFSGGTGNVKFTWDFGDNSPLFTGQVPTKVYSGVSDSDNPYKVTLYAEELNNHCRDSITKPVIVNYKPKASFYTSSSQVCENTQVDFFNSSFMPDLTGFSSSWTMDGNTITSASPSYIFGKSGTYPVQLIITAPNSKCSDTAYGSIAVTTAPVVKISHVNTDAPYGTYRFSPSITDAISYTWHMGDLSNTVVNTRNVDYHYNETGLYNIRLDILDKSGCKSFAFDTVNVFQRTGVESILADKISLNTYPNPFTDNLHVDFTLDKTYQVQVILSDVLGKEVYKTEMQKMGVGKQSIQVKNGIQTLESGTYLLKLRLNDQEINLKLIRN